MAEPARGSRYEDSLSYYLGNAESIGVEWPKGADVSRFYRAVRIGFNVQSTLTVRQRTHIRAKVFNRVLPRTTLQSRQQSGARLNPEQSEKVLRIANGALDAAPLEHHLVAAEVPDDARTTRIPHVPHEPTATGRDWLRSGDSLILSVPSVVIPEARNLIINPLHPDMGKVSVENLGVFIFDARIR